MVCEKTIERREDNVLPIVFFDTYLNLQEREKSNIPPPERIPSTMRYYISDLHFFHSNLNQQMDCRGFGSGKEMNAHMIEQWNKKVRKNDEVVVLGDFSIGKGAQTNEILQSLNGTKYLIEGNHDRFLKDREFDQTLLGWIKPYAELSDNKRKVVLCHYPVFCYNGQYRLDQENQPKVYMLYGHVHNTFDEALVQSFQKQTREIKREIRGKEGLQSIPCNMINCFCMFSDYTPLTLDEWINFTQGLYNFGQSY